MTRWSAGRNCGARRCLVSCSNAYTRPNCFARPARSFRFALDVQLMGNLQRVGIQLDDSVESEAGPVNRLDLREIALRDGARAADDRWRAAGNPAIAELRRRSRRSIGYARLARVEPAS